MNQFITAADVRTFANISGTTGRYSDASIGSNIIAAQGFLQREAARLFEKRDAATFSFTTEGRAAFAIPDLRNVTTVTWDGTDLTQNESYWLIPDAKQSGIYVALQLRVFRREGNWFYSNPEWWDRGLDWNRPLTSEPNDLTILGDWGWDPLPEDVLHAVKVLAAWYTKRADALLAGAVANPEGAILDYSRLPPEVSDVIRTYQRGEQATVI